MLALGKCVNKHFFNIIIHETSDQFKKSNLQIKVVYKCSCSFQTLKQATLLICNTPPKRLIEGPSFKID